MAAINPDELSSKAALELLYGSRCLARDSGPQSETES